ncbi:MAG: Hsp70 family protein [Rickettsiaceae bacterium]|nr:Hsp70 family protein [Rickettsiaceae bacterium]
MLLDIVDPSQKINKNTNALIVGIDFGTTNSLIAVSGDKGPYLISMSQDSVILPSEIKIEDINIKSIKRLFGRSRQELINSNAINNQIKSILCENEGQLYLNIHGRKIHIIEIASKIFSSLKKAAEKELNQEVKKAVVTVPAYFDDSAKSMVKQSASLAGIEVIRLIPEPTAACYYYGLDTKAEGRYMVYDLGGGTFDVSIVKIKNGVFKVEALGGDTVLGGDDIDFNIARYLADKYESSKDVTDNLLGAAKFLKENIKDGSCALGKYSLTTEELDLIAENIIAKTIKIAQKVHREIDRAHLDGIILVGGSTKCPLVAKELKKSFGSAEIMSEVNPDTIVALGAGMLAMNLNAKFMSPIVDLVPLSLGVELMGGLVDVIIPRNTQLPVSCARKFTTQVDGQTGMEFHIVQGDREVASLCRSLAKFSIKNLTPKKAGNVQVELKFDIDICGLVSVSAYEINGSAKESFDIKPTFGLSDKDLYDMLKSAMENIERDRAEAEILKLKQEIRDTINAVRPLLMEKIAESIEEKNILLTKTNDIFAKLDILSPKELKSEFETYRTLVDSFMNTMVNKSLAQVLRGKNIKQILE